MPRLTLLPRVAFDDVDVAGERPAALLAALAADPAAGRSAGRLVAELWPDAPPADPAKALQVVVSRVRSRLGAQVVETTATGYRLALAPSEVDATALAAHAREARSAPDPAQALAAADAGLALWPGARAESAGADEPEPAGGPRARRTGVADGPLAVLRADALRILAELRRHRAVALSRLGRAAVALPALEELRGEKDEELLLELLRSEAAVRGPAAALARYDAYRRELAEELGTDPGAALRAQQAVLLAESAPVRRRGLVSEPNPLRGREADVERVLALLRSSRVVTVLGPGGLGKTRLAHAVAARADQRTVQVVSLAGVRTGADVAAAVVEAVAAGSMSGAAPDPAGAVAEALGAGLLVLDNCEHVLDAAADLVHAVIARTRELRVLATSRAPLDLSAEAVYPLPQLDPAVTVALFCERARAARPDVSLPEDEVATLCARLDGLPLAVELAAARVRTLSVPDILRRLDDRFALLRGTGRDRPARHRTLEAVVEWSWNLLTDEARATLRLLAGLPGGFTAGTAEDLLGADPLDLLEALVDQSLLRPPDAGGRFRMLETVREFAAARRVPADRVDERVLGWGRRTGTALHAAPFGPDPRPPLDRIRAEQDNLLHVLRLARAHEDRATLAAVTATLGALWTLESGTRRLLAVGAETLPALSRYRPTDAAGLAALRQSVAQYASLAVLVSPVAATRPLVVLRSLRPADGEAATGGAAAIAALAEVLLALPDVGRIAELSRDPRPLVAALALGVVGYVREFRGDLAGAHAAAVEMAARAPGRAPWLALLVRGRLAELSLQRERHAEALDHLRAAGAALAELGVVGDPVGVRLGQVVAHLGLGDAAAAERVLATVPPGDSLDSVAFALAVRAELALTRGDVDTGLARWREASRMLDVDDATSEWLRPFAWTLRATAVVAHLRAGRLAAVADLADALPAGLDALVAAGAPDPQCGALLLAIGLVELERGRTVRGAWLVAVAERFHYQRDFQPTMAGAAIRARVTDAAGPAYAEATAEYAGLDRDDLRAEARALAAAYRDLV
ncbi:ATP-binding protein [Pseudonocardia xishanensis]|uniref:BTAD domain-containing putative transcriptional regulator n=1 Tax=Pseudonocardia xishanensis TaxID=630995 RepID=A0ABP8S3M1_9PSEU